MNLEVIAQCGLQLGEAPVWSAERNQLLWIDLPTGQLWRHDFQSGKTRYDTLAVEPMLGAIAPTIAPEILLLTHRRGVSLVNIDTLEIMPFADPEQARDGVMYNDAKVDRLGRLWVGTSHVRETEPRGALWVVDANGDCRFVDAGFAIANGPAFSPDGHTAYFSDSLAKQILAYDVSVDGAVSGRRVFCRFGESEGLPDGLTVDAAGYVWVAHWAGSRVSRRNSEGEAVMTIDVPAPHATSLCFGGANYKDLFITTAWDSSSEATRRLFPGGGNVLRLAADVQGLPEPRFVPTTLKATSA